MSVPEKLKKLWSRVPRLPRSWRIVRNLAAAALLAVLALALLEWPCLDAHSAFQRLEGAYLLTPSRLVLQQERGKGAAFLSEGDSWIAVGSVSAFDGAGMPLNLGGFQAVLHQVLPKEGIVAVLLPVKSEDNGGVVAVWGGPEEAVSGTLELELKGIEDPAGRSVSGLETFAAQAKRREDGWFIFRFTPHDNHREGQSCAMEMWLWFGPWFHTKQMEQPYRLTLTDAQGRTVAEQSGILPPDQQLRQW